jgi:hypothetical protein
MRRVIVLAVVISVLMSLAISAPAAAAVLNDTVAGAIDIDVGADITEDTTTATTDGEAGLNDQFCGAPAMEAGVWFAITEPTDTAASFNTEESDYGTGILVFEGDPIDGLSLACGPGQVVVSLTGGVTYTFVVFGDGTTAATSGTMILHVEEAIPPPEITVTIDPTGRVNKSGQAMITGTVTCTSTDGSGTVFEVFGDVSQRVGRVLIRGFFDSFTEIPCDGSTNTWEAIAIADNGVFAGGKAAVFAIAFGCTDVCNEGSANATVRLRKGGNF